MNLKSRYFLALLCAALNIFSVVPYTDAQIESPDRKYLFQEDKNKEKIEKQRKKEQQQRKSRSVGAMQGAPGLPFDISASTLNYDSTGNIVTASGNVLLTYSSLVAEAREGRVDIAKNRAFLKGDVRLTDVTSYITADEASIDIEDGSGEMRNVDMTFTDGDYHIVAAQVSRDNTDTFSLKDALMSTCDCPEQEDCSPWSLHASEASVQRNGYGSAWHSTLRVRDVPVLYLPYIFFPAKNERQSGFLPARFGTGRQSGFNIDLPLFLAFDRSSDATVTTVYESNLRIGPDVELRKVFSRKSRAQAGIIYFNESERDGNLYGTDVEDFDDPTLDENRLAGYLDYSWKGEAAGVPLQLLVDGGYASDDLFIREYEKEEIAKYNDRYITSTAVLRAPLFGSYSADFSAEGNQAIISDDDFVFQRVPELTISGLDSFRPFGENPLGLKLVLNTSLNSVRFLRSESYDGSRTEANEKLSLPFHFRNYFDGSIDNTLRASRYQVNLDEDEEAREDSGIASSSGRLVPGVGGRISTVMERVYVPEDDNPIKVLGELGRIGKNYQLSRVKHTIEPGVKYRYVPFVDQTENPQFDSDDRLSERNVLTYGLTQRLLGRYEPRNTYLYGIEEVTPELRDLGNLGTTQPLDRDLTFGYNPQISGSEYSAVRRGSIQELVQFKLSQSFDINQERNSGSGEDEDNNFEEDSFSDVAADLILLPNDHFRARTRADFDAREQHFTSYSIEGNAITKRGDLIFSRLRFVDSDDKVRQLESGIEVRLSEFIRLGYYSRYDDAEGEFLEHKAGVRFYSSCRCWIFDLDVRDKLNPDETKFSFNVTLVGLGELGNTFFTRPEEEGS